MIISTGWLRATVSGRQTETLQMTRTVKRFIAGAVCPRCSEMDKITMFEEEGTQFRECVACGFKDQQGGSGGGSGGISKEVPGASPELQTRVNQPRSEAKVEPVVFFRAAVEESEKR